MACERVCRIATSDDGGGDNSVVERGEKPEAIVGDHRGLRRGKKAGGGEAMVRAPGAGVQDGSGRGRPVVDAFRCAVAAGAGLGGQGGLNQRRERHHERAGEQGQGDERPDQIACSCEDSRHVVFDIKRSWLRLHGRVCMNNAYFEGELRRGREGRVRGECGRMGCAGRQGCAKDQWSTSGGR